MRHALRLAVPKTRVRRCSRTCVCLKVHGSEPTLICCAQRMNTSLRLANSQLTPSRVVGLFGVCMAALQCAVFHGVRGDDAFITYRYGQNLASGSGLVFSPGQYVQGFTSPGHALLSALVYAYFDRAATPGVMSALGCVAWSVEALALYWYLERTLGRTIAAACALLIALGGAAGASWVVLETHFVLACVLGGFALAVRERWILAAISCGLGVLFRPDAGLAAVLVLGACIRQLRLRALRPVLAFLLVALPWPIFASVYYGSPLPQTALTKFQRSGLFQYLMHELGYPSQRLLWHGAPLWFTFVVMALAGWGACRAWRRGAWLLPAYGLLHAAAYLHLRPFVQHAWHLYPWSVAVCACSCIGLASLPGSARAFSFARAGLCAGLLLISLYRFSVEARTLDAGYWTGQRDAVYRRIAAELVARARPGEEFASVEVGTIAYYSDLTAYDLGGLVTLPGDSMRDHAVRFLVVDKAYPQLKPAAAPSFVATEGGFEASVYEFRQRQ